MSKLKVLSLGAGVQSSTILLMAIKGELEKPDVTIFADTGWENPDTYKHLEWLKAEAERAGIPILTVSKGNIRHDLLNAADTGCRFASIPAYTLLKGTLGRLKRQCTTDYKIVPIKQEIRHLLGVKPHTKLPAEAVELWVGISIDEYKRVASFTRNPQWLSATFPLTELKPMTRNECIAWLKENYPDRVIPRSACLGCPFKCDEEWRLVKDNNEHWDDVVYVDDKIRHTKGFIKSDELYLHRSCQRLSDVDLRTETQKGQAYFPFYKDEKLLLFGSLPREVGHENTGLHKEVAKAPRA